MKIKQNKIQNNKNNSIYLTIFLVLLIGVLCIYIYYKNQEPFENNSSNSNSKSKIIIPDIIGGLGNQLFVVAAAYAYSKDNNYKLMLDNRKDVYSYGKPRETYNDTLFRKIPIYTADKTNFINMNENEYVSRTTNNSSNSSINTITNSNIFLTGGYYQEANYFNKYKNEIIDLFEPTQDINNEVNELCKLNNINLSQDFLVAIHIRLDDVYTPIDADKRVYDKDEYDIIIQKLPEHLESNPNTKFILFSNDIPRTTDIFKSAQIDSSRIIYIQSKDYIELALIAKCNNYIASPSTFNWWGIYLNKNPEKQIFIYWKQDSDYRKDFYKKYEYLQEYKICNSIQTLSNEINNNSHNNSHNNITYITGLWDIKRGNMDSDNFNWNRKFEDYTNYLKKLLSTNKNFVVFGDTNIKNIVNEYKNAIFVYYSIVKFKTEFPFYNKVNNIRLDTKWLHQEGAEWLKTSPQATLELFNPVTMSKMYFLKQISISNPFNTERFYWVDAGIIRTHDQTIFTNLEHKLIKYDKFLFLKFKYELNNEIHGFQRFAINKYCNTNNVNYVARAQFFGGLLSNINNVINEYNNILEKTLNDGYMGTEESIFTIMTYTKPDLYNLVLIKENDGINTLNSL